MVMHLRSEQDRLLSSMYDHESEGRALSDQTKDISQQPIMLV